MGLKKKRLNPNTLSPETLRSIRQGLLEANAGMLIPHSVVMRDLKKFIKNLPIWIVQINLGGISGPIKMKWYDEDNEKGWPKGYWDNTGDIESISSHKGCLQLKFETEKEAKAARLGIDLMCRHLKDWMGEKI